MFRAHRPAGERRHASSRVPAGPDPRGGAARGRRGTVGGGRARARVVALALAGVMAAGGLWMAGGARTIPGLRSPTGGAGAGAAGSGTPGVVTQARPLTPPVTAAGANARAPVPFSSHERSTRAGGVTAGHATTHGAKEQRPGKPPKPKPRKPKPEKPSLNRPSPRPSPTTRSSRTARRQRSGATSRFAYHRTSGVHGGSGCDSALIDGGRPWRSPCCSAPVAAASSAS